MAENRTVHLYDDPDTINRLLQQRAARYAAVAAGQESDTGTEVLEVVLAGTHYFLATAFLSEVFHFREYTRIPGMPEYVMGLVAVRGTVLPVYEIKRMLGLSGAAVSDLNKVIVLEYQGTRVAILADRIIRITRLYEPELKITGSEKSSYGVIAGITGTGDVFLSVPALLNHPGFVF